MRKNILLIFALTAVIFFGCNEKSDVSGEKKNETKQETRNESAENKSEEVSKDDKNEDSQAPSQTDINKSNELGMTPGMPPDFPSDVPQPKNSKTLGSLNSSVGTVVTFESKDKVQDIVNFYKEEMKKNGYVISEDGELITPDKGGLINWKKGDKTVEVVLGYNEDRNITSLVITYK